jgi:hypothetical protein
MVQAMNGDLDEKEQLRGFILHALDFVLGRQQDAQSTALLAKLREPVESSRSVAGLREASRDMIEWCQDLRTEEVGTLDRRLLRAGLPTLTVMRDRRYRALIRVLSQGRIGSEAEYRLLCSYASDVANGALSQSDRQRVERILTDYHRSAR